MFSIVIRQFNENNPKRYRLLKFVDARDPRMKSTFRNLSNAKNKENIGNPMTEKREHGLLMSFLVDARKRAKIILDMWFFLRQVIGGITTKRVPLELTDFA